MSNTHLHKTGFIREEQKTKQVKCIGTNKTENKVREYWVWLLLKMIWSGGVTERKMPKNRFQENERGETGSYARFWGKSILGGGNSTCKGSEPSTVLET